MNGTVRLFLGMFSVLIFVIGLGQCEEQQSKASLEEYIRAQGSKGRTPDLGVEEPRKPTIFLKYEHKEPDCLSKDEFYQGMEDAEMKGMADDPSAQDIYDEFNR